MTTELFAYFRDGHWNFQNAPYIEDGEYIKEVSGKFLVMSIPQYGGFEGDISSHETFSEAVKAMDNLT